MSTYKVLQDIEAEDKLVGPLSLRQFIYAGVAAVSLYVCFLAYTRGVPFLLVFFLPVAAIGIFFAFPWKGEQPTEIWALARLRFMVKPRVRIWNQSGIKDVVSITVPRNLPARPQARNLSQYEVRSRLKALADTIDSRGWATRNANYSYYMNQQRPQSDRLVNATDMQPGSIPMDAFLPSNDMLDDQNPVAQNLDALLNRSSVAQRQRVVEELNNTQVPAALIASMQEPTSQSALPPRPYGPNPVQPAQMQMPSAAPMTGGPQLPAPVMPAGGVPNSYWFVNNGAPAPEQPVPQLQPAPQQYTSRPASAFMPTAAATSQNAAPASQETIPADYGNMRVVQTPGGPIPTVNTPVIMAAATPAEPVTRRADPAILNLANNDDLDVATIARRIHKDIKKSSNEVEVRLR